MIYSKPKVLDAYGGYISFPFLSSEFKNPPEIYQGVDGVSKASSWLENFELVQVLEALWTSMRALSLGNY